MLLIKLATVARPHFTLHACTRGKAISFVCRHHRRLSLARNRQISDLGVQATRKHNESIKSG